MPCQRQVTETNRMMGAKRSGEYRTSTCEYWTKEFSLVSLVWTGLRRPAGPQAGGTGPAHTNANARRRATGDIAPGLVPVRPISVDSPPGLRGQFTAVPRLAAQPEPDPPPRRRKGQMK